jgi:hypothetical protein
MNIQAPDVLSVIRATMALITLYTVVVYAKLIAIGVAITAGIVVAFAIVAGILDFRDSIRLRNCGYFKPQHLPQEDITNPYVSESFPFDTSAERPFVRRRRSRSGSY